MKKLTLLAVALLLGLGCTGNIFALPIPFNQGVLQIKLSDKLTNAGWFLAYPKTYRNEPGYALSTGMSEAKADHVNYWANEKLLAPKLEYKAYATLINQKRGVSIRVSVIEKCDENWASRIGICHIDSGVAYKVIYGTDEDVPLDKRTDGTRQALLLLKSHSEA